MLFDRYRKSNKRPEPQKSSSLASAFFRALTRRAWHPSPPPQQRQDSGVDILPPRTSTSLPNISRYNASSTALKPPILVFSHDHPISKRHSTGYPLLKDATKKKKRRHSYTYGNNPDVTVAIPRRSVSHQPSTQAKPAAAKGVPLSGERLADMLQQKEDITLIDVRHLFDYQKRRIDGSLNVNLPSLLIKRYQRGTVSNFNLENFITTSEGRERYRAGAKPHQWVVYDDDMGDQTSQAWTLLNVLDRIGDVYYLEGGFKAFQSDEYLVEGFEEEVDQDEAPLVQLPRRSLSYTMGTPVDKSHLHRRTSLFSLDTQAARANNANALARRANKRSLQIEQEPQVLLQAPSATTSTSSSLTRVVEDEDDGISPQTEADFEFIISEIIPGFLFVGPEIETAEQAQQLEARKIKRVLNMAEECNDEVLSEEILYRKISARDTVEMKNIDWVMMEAVCFIEDAKRGHEPIYVHCKAGKSRSVTAILAYLVCSERWTLKQAYRHVIKARPNMSPNIGFIAELMKMEGRVHGRVSSFMETDWQSTSMPSPEFTRELMQLERAWQQTPRDGAPPVALR